MMCDGMVFLYEIPGPYLQHSGVAGCGWPGAGAGGGCGWRVRVAGAVVRARWPSVNVRPRPSTSLQVNGHTATLSSDCSVTTHDLRHTQDFRFHCTATMEPYPGT